MGKQSATQQTQGPPSTLPGGGAVGVDPKSYLWSLAPLAAGLIGGAAMGSPGMGLAAGTAGAIKQAGNIYTGNQKAKAIAGAEQQRVRGQGAGAKIAGLSDPELLNAIAGADEKTFDAFIKTMGAHGAQNLTSQFAGDAGYDGFGPSYQGGGGGAQSFDPVASEAYQQMLVPQLRQMSQFAHENPTAGEIQAAITGDTSGLGGGGSVANRMDTLVPKNMLDFMKTQPTYNPDAMNTQLGNEYKGGVLEGSIGAKNAENQGIMDTAIPLAKAGLVKKQFENLNAPKEAKIKELKAILDNQKTQRETEKLGLGNQAAENQLKVDQILSEKDYSTLERLQGFQDAVGMLQQKEADPNVFRSKAMEVLRRSNLPPEQLAKYQEYIENIRLMKIQAYTEDPANQGVAGGMFGMGQDAQNKVYQQFLDELRSNSK